MAELGEPVTRYHVRVFCDTHLQYFRTTQDNYLDSTWIPTECAAHPGSVRDFVIELEETVYV